MFKKLFAWLRGRTESHQDLHNPNSVPNKILDGVEAGAEGAATVALGEAVGKATGGNPLLTTVADTALEAEEGANP